MTADLLAQEVGISYSFLASLESGTRQSVSPEVFRKLAFRLYVTDVRAIMANPYGDYEWQVSSPALKSECVPTP